MLRSAGSGADERPSPAESDPPAQITDLLIAWRAGDVGSLRRLTALVYDDLRAIARGHRMGERVDHTLTTTALVHEAFLRLVDLKRIDWNDRAHFFAVASGAMRRVLVDYARRFRAAKRGGGLERVELDEAAIAIEQRAELLLAVDVALERLATVDARLARVVECRFFGGLTDEDTAAVVGVSVRTVRRDWTKARGWLYQELAE